MFFNRSFLFSFKENQQFFLPKKNYGRGDDVPLFYWLRFFLATSPYMESSLCCLSFVVWHRNFSRSFSFGLFFEEKTLLNKKCPPQQVLLSWVEAFNDFFFFFFFPSLIFFSFKVTVGCLGPKKFISKSSDHRRNLPLFFGVVVWMRSPTS